MFTQVRRRPAAAPSVTFTAQFKWMKVDYDAGAAARLDLPRVMQQLQQQLSDIPVPPPGSAATHVLVTGSRHVPCAHAHCRCVQLDLSLLAGLLHHTVCFTSLSDTLAVLKGYMQLLQHWQLQRGARAAVLWRTAEAFGDFKDHEFALANGSTLVMRGRCVVQTRCRSVDV